MISARPLSVRVDDGWSKPHSEQRANSVTKTSFANLKKKSSSHSLLLSIVITSGFPDVSTHVHSFHERRGATFRVSQARYRRVASLWRVDQGKTVAFCAPSTEISWEQPGLCFLQGVRELQWNKDTLVKTYMADMHKRLLPMSSSRREPSTKNLRGARYSGEWQRLLLRRTLRIACQPIGRCLTTSFLNSWS